MKGAPEKVDLTSAGQLLVKIRGFKEKWEALALELRMHKGLLPKDQLPDLVKLLVEVLIPAGDYLALVAHLFHDHDVGPDYEVLDEIAEMLFEVGFEELDDCAEDCFPCIEEIHTLTTKYSLLIAMFDGWLDAKSRPETEGTTPIPPPQDNMRREARGARDWKAVPLGTKRTRPLKQSKFIVIVFTDPVQVFEFDARTSAELYVRDLSKKYPGVKAMIAKAV